MKVVDRNSFRTNEFLSETFAKEHFSWQIQYTQLPLVVHRFAVRLHARLRLSLLPSVPRGSILLLVDTLRRSSHWRNAALYTNKCFINNILIISLKISKSIKCKHFWLYLYPRTRDEETQANFIPCLIPVTIWVDIYRGHIEREAHKHS